MEVDANEPEACGTRSIDANEPEACGTLRELLMTWLSRYSFDECVSEYHEAGFLAVSELLQRLKSFVGAGEVSYTAGLSLVGLGRLLAQMKVGCRRSRYATRSSAADSGSGT